jgi:hypothetical protein
MPSIGTAIVSAASIIGGKLSGDAAKDAAQIQADAGYYASKVNKEIYDQNRKDSEPWRNVGSEAIYKLSDLLGLKTDRGASDNNGYLMNNFSMDDFKADPGYQFRLNEGNKAIDRASAARGGFNSGATYKDLLRYGSDYASGEYQNAWNRDDAEKNRAYNYLAGTSGAGQASANTLANVGSNYAANAGNIAMNTGNARAAGVVGNANAMSQGFSGAYNAYSMGKFMDLYAGGSF